MNADGSAHKVSPTTCTQGLQANIASGVTYALQGVMRGGGTGASANPDDGTPIMGKTGTTDDSLQNWLVTSTSKVSTATWVGNVSGATPLRSLEFNGVGGGDVKFSIAQPILAAIDGLYGGSAFTKPTNAVLYGDQVTIPDVSGKTPTEAQTLLQGLGLDATIDSTPVDSAQPAGAAAGTDPAAGTSANKGSPVTVQVSDGQVTSIPSGLVGKTESEAKAALNAAGFTNVTVKTSDTSGGGGGDGSGGSNGSGDAGGKTADLRVTVVDPAEGTAARKDAAIVLTLG